ncbi:Protease inhibitor precursor [Sporotomaculum syntrophicum]|uniref:Protease inhibitor n=1 Tax=Sporotomaculum syntrophicum TaxID=182264 RepID=A0A9D3AXZ0_9FIRM|nr:substrate-binding domain-containing protein [Sporotomaculum syntrophicum]KAF1084193.1 Protease inhibitor precursor [Sporotomaculum syntrophicum]
MKKQLSLILALMLVFALGSAAALAAPPAVQVIINDEQVIFPDQGAFLDVVSGRTFVPLRFVSEALDVAVKWDKATQSAIVTMGDSMITMPVGSSQATVDGQAVALDSPAKLQNQRVMVPLSFVSEVLGKTVDWNEAEMIVTVSGELEPSIRLASTIGPIDAGIVGALAELFEEKTGIKVEFEGAGTGKALEMAKTGDFDLVLVHAKALEEQFVNEGWGTERIDLMYNDYVFVGPASDPAGIEGLTPTEALKKIMEMESQFISRGDKSGTHVAEMELWKAAEMEPKGDWYQVWEGGSQGNSATLRYTNEQQAYTVIDRATYLTLKNEITLKVLVEKHESLLNYITLIPVNPDKFPQVKHDMVMKFVDFTTSDEGQTLIQNFKKDVYGEPLFFPNSAQWRAKATQK